MLPAIGGNAKTVMEDTGVYRRPIALTFFVSIVNAMFIHEADKQKSASEIQDILNVKSGENKKKPLDSGEKRDEGFDNIFALGGKNQRSHQFLNWWQHMSTGHMHLDGFESPTVI